MKRNANTPQLKEVEHPPSLREVAKQAIKRGIVENIFKPGEIYNESSLATELGMSKTPVREALLDLAARGFLTLLPRRGFMVNDLSADDIHNLYEFRWALETAIVRLVTAQLTDKELAKIRKCHHRALEATRRADLMAYLQADRELHYTLASLTDNTYMIEALENVRDLIDWMGMKALLRKERIHEVNQEHAEVIACLERRDVEGAVQSMASHVEMTEKNVLAWKNRQG